MSLETDENGEPIYAFKPSVMGAMSQFALRSGGMDWRVGNRGGQIPYDRIAAIRLSFRPVTMQSHRFIAEIWSPGNPKLQIASASWRSIMEQQRFDAAYKAFIVELHRRLAGAGAKPQLTSGLQPAIYAVGIAVFAAIMIATGIMGFRALAAGQWSAAAVVGAFFAVFVYQLGTYFYRNRPARYRADLIPPGILPSG